MLEEFQSRRQKGNDRVFEEDFLPVKRFFALDSRAYDDGEIPQKYKELMGLTASMALRCDDCILYHIDQSIKKGCTRAELNEAMNIALIAGGSIVIPHLRKAYQAIDEILDEPDK